MPRSPVIATQPPGTTPKAPLDVIGSAVWNAAMNDIYQIFNTAQPIEYGGTNATTAAQARINLGLQIGVDVASIAAIANLALKMDTRRNLSVNGSCLVSAENGDTLGTANGYFWADQKALYRSADLAGKISAQRVAYTSLAGGSKAAEFKCVSTASLISTSLATDTDFIEGSDPDFVAAGWGAAGAKPIMHRLEVQKPSGIYSLHVTNQAGNRHCWVQYTVSAPEANTRVVKEIQIPGDTGGTWAKTDGTIGATIDDVLVIGSSFVGGTTGVWSGSAFYGGAGQKNFLDNTANVARHTDFGMRLDPDNTGVYGAYRVGETDAVRASDRYWTLNPSATGFWTETSAVEFYFAPQLPLKMAKTPVCAVFAGTSAVLRPNVGSYNITSITDPPTLARGLSVGVGTSGGALTGPAVVSAGAISLNARLS